MTITQEQLNSCFSIADVCRLVGWVPSGDNYRRAKELINNMDISHFRKGPWNKGKKVKLENVSLSLEELLVENSTHKNTNKIKKRLFKEGLKEERCEICGYTENLELHHINGNPTDNRIENLQILCPNCHAKTENFRGKNKLTVRTHTPADELFLTDAEVVKRYEEKLLKKREYNRKKYIEEHPNVKHREFKEKVILTCPVCGKEFVQTHNRTKYCSIECQRESMLTSSKRPSFIELVNSLKECKNFTATGKKYNVTDNTIRKWCKLYQIPVHTKEMQEYINKISLNFEG